MIQGNANDDATTDSIILHDKWKLPTPSRIAINSFSRIVAFDEYSGNLR